MSGGLSEGDLLGGRVEEDDEDDEGMPQYSVWKSVLMRPQAVRDERLVSVGIARRRTFSVVLTSYKSVVQHAAGVNG